MTNGTNKVGLCTPCCFKNLPTGSINRCIPNENIDIEENKQKNNTVLTNINRLEENRLGTIPEIIHTLLLQNVNYTNCSPEYLTEVFLRSLKMKWGTSESDDVRVVQDLSRLSYIGYLSHLRRLNLPLDRTLKIYNPHRLHLHQFGFVCPYETPDGGSIGLLKNLAYLTKISAGTPEIDVGNE